MSYNYLFKLILIGDSAVGKTWLLQQSVHKKVRENSAVTISAEKYDKIIEFNGLIIKLEIWDTVGDERYKCVTRNYYRRAAGVIIVYDITRKQSFKNVSNWLSDVQENGNSNISVVLVGNKSDLIESRQVSQGEARTFARNNDIDFVEVSAKTANNTEDAFIKIAQQILKKIINNEIDPKNKDNGIIIRSEQDSEKSLVNNNSQYIQLQQQEQKKECC